ncbi:DEKNAAC103501 [Brettanomyces naardenensis]|uniref:Uridine kinase n=1 Tax=Brettanomyces naardenensis TaxID=13370 RepID=A0A448YN09_BRENA|nr:DEKNAAC103501 [Brettanomyces naardenensis]
MPDSLSAQATQYIPPWKSPYIIGIAGFSGSGKTTVAQKILQEINEPWTVLMSMDNFYRPLTAEQREKAFENEFDFDKPDALDLDLMCECIKSLKEGKKTEIPVYSFASHSRTNQKITIYGVNVIILEGLYTLYNPDLAKFMDCKVYVDTDLDICYSRRLLRDIVERGRDLEGIIKQWDKFVKPNSVRYVKPTMQSADIIIPRGTDNKIAMDLLIEHIHRQLAAKSAEHLLQLKALGKVEKPIDYNKVHVLPSTNQLEGMKTILLDRDTPYDSFIFYFNRVASILISHALDFIEYVPSRADNRPVISPTGLIVKDTMFIKDEIIAVDIIRAGDCFIPSLKKMIPGVKVGKLLIQSDSRTGEPHLHTEKLPALNTDCNLLLFDAQVISGAAATMAIKVLLDYGVSEERVVMCTYLATEAGVKRISNAFPKVTIVVGSLGTSDPSRKGVDHDMDSWMANRFIDARYFGTD